MCYTLERLYGKEGKMESIHEEPVSGIRSFTLSLILGVVFVIALIGSSNTPSQMSGNLLAGLASFSGLGSVLCLIGSSCEDD